jgi:hypothetical protein
MDGTAKTTEYGRTKHDRMQGMAETGDPVRAGRAEQGSK